MDPTLFVPSILFSKYNDLILVFVQSKTSVAPLRFQNLNNKKKTFLYQLQVTKEEFREEIGESSRRSVGWVRPPVVTVYHHRRHLPGNGTRRGSFAGQKSPAVRNTRTKIYDKGGGPACSMWVKNLDHRLNLKRIFIAVQLATEWERTLSLQASWKKDFYTNLSGSESLRDLQGRRMVESKTIGAEFVEPATTTERDSGKKWFFLRFCEQFSVTLSFP